MEHSYNFIISAKTREEADRIATALNVIYKNIKNENLIEIAEMIIKDPQVVNKAIKVANNPMVKRLYGKG